MATSAVALADTGVEINNTVYDISFRAVYDSYGNIQILYMHNFPAALTFNTSSIIWA